MNRRRRLRYAAGALALGFACVLVGDGPVSAQGVAAGIRVDTYGFSGGGPFEPDEVQLVSVPWQAGWDLGQVSLDVRGAYANAIATFPGAGYTEVSGPTDVQASAALRAGRLSFTGFAVAPVGLDRYDAEQLPLLGLLSSELLPFGLRTWGTGGGFGAAVAGDGRIEAVSFRLSAGYVGWNEYQALTTTDPTYQPGTEMRVSLEAWKREGDDGVISAVLGHQRFQADGLEGDDVFRTGSRTEVFLTYSEAVGARESLNLYGALYLRGAGALLTPDSQPPEWTLPGLEQSRSRFMGIAGAELRAERGRLAVVPSLEVRAMTVDAEYGSGHLAIAAVAMDYRLAGSAAGPALVASPRIGGSFGRHAGRSGDVSIAGWRVELVGRWVGPR